MYILQLFDKERKLALLDRPEFAALFYQLLRETWEYFLGLGFRV